MSEQDFDLRMEIALGLAGETPDGAHPSTETLVAYREGDLGEEAGEGLREHLAHCHQCLGDFLDLDSFVTAGQGSPLPTTDLGAAATWRSLRGALGRRSLPWPSLAAALLGVCLGLGWWAAHQRSIIRQPQADAAIFYLAADDVALRGPVGGGEAKELPAGADFLIVELDLGGEPERESLQVELQDSRSQTLWEGSAKALGPTLTLRLHRSHFSSGRYRILVSAPGPGVEQPLKAFTLDIALENVKD